jgi:purine-cytosine permease-like protein
MKRLIAAILLALTLGAAVPIAHADIGPCNGCHASPVRPH